MKVYVIEYYDDVESHVVGVFRSEQSAKEAIDKYIRGEEQGDDWGYSYDVYEVQD